MIKFHGNKIRNIRKSILKKILKSKKLEFVNVIINPNQKIVPKLKFGNLIEIISSLIRWKEFKRYEYRINCY